MALSPNYRRSLTKEELANIDQFETMLDEEIRKCNHVNDSRLELIISDDLMLNKMELEFLNKKYIESGWSSLELHRKDGTGYKKAERVLYLSKFIRSL